MSEIEIPDGLVATLFLWETAKVGYDSGTASMALFDMANRVLASGFETASECADARRPLAIAALRREVLESVVEDVAKAFAAPARWDSLSSWQRVGCVERARRLFDLPSEGEGT